MTVIQPGFVAQVPCHLDWQECRNNANIGKYYCSSPEEAAVWDMIAEPSQLDWPA
jgi:hypothetical protein